MSMFKRGLGALAVAGLTVAFFVEYRAQTRLAAENLSLRQQLAQLQAGYASLSQREPPAKFLLRRPAPSVRVSVQTNLPPAEDLPATNLYARFNHDQPRLSPAQVEAYLKANGRRPATLLAAYRTSGDPALLKEALDKYPKDPQVAFEAAFAVNLSPEQRRQALSAFEQAAPDNALSHYLSAFDDFKSGQTDRAIEEVTAAYGKRLDDFTADRIMDDKEAYLSAGYSVPEAERIASSWLLLPQLSELKQLGQNMAALANSYNQSGDPASAQAALQIALDLGRQYGDVAAQPALISQLVGIAIERIALQAMDPNSPLEGGGQTVQDRLNQLEQQKAALRDLGDRAEPLMQSLSDQDWSNYTQRRMLFGEAAALQWVVNKYRP